MTKRQRNSIIKQINKQKAIIYKARNELRELLDEVEGILDSSDEAVNSLECAVDALSQYV